MYGISKRSFSLRHIYSKHRRLQILEKNEQPALVNTPVLQDPNQVHLLWRTEVTPVAYKREHCQLHFVAIETLYFFFQSFRQIRHYSINPQNLSYYFICIAILQYYPELLPFPFLSWANIVPSSDHT